ncbi:MAG: tandem-95 repeat protein [Candidatus Cryosericum sp.]
MSVDVRRKACLFVVCCLLTIAGCLTLGVGVARGATQTLGGVPAEGSLYIAVGDTGQMSVARYAGGTWQAQAFSQVPPNLSSKGSKLYTATYGAQPLGYFPSGGPAATANYVSGNQIVTQWTLAGDIQVTQRTTYTSPNAYYRLDWSITNLSGSTITDLRFFHGEDTYLAGGDAAAGWWDGSTVSVGAYRNSSGVEQRMSLQGVTPPSHYASKQYGAVSSEGGSNRLSDQLDASQSTDNGYALEWDLGTLANGSTWSITAYEKFVAGAIGALTVNSPITVDCYAGNSCSIAYAVSNPTATPVSATASISGNVSWGQHISSPGTSFSVPANSVVNVIVPVSVPAGTPAGTTGNFTLTVNDGSTNSSSSTAVVAQIPPNSPPSATPQSVTATEDTPLGITLTGSDPDGNPITYTVVSGPFHGSLSGSAPSLVYIPSANYPSGHADASDSFTFTVADSYGATSALATASITVLSVNDAPVFSGIGNQTMVEDTPRLLTLSATDADGDAIVYAVSGGSAATVSASLAGNQLTLTPAVDYNTSGPISFTVTASDGLGGTASTTFTVTVTAVNDAPSFTKGADQTVNEDCGPQTVSSWATNLSAGPADEAGQALTFLTTADNPSLFSVQPAVSSTGTLTYTPAPDANGMATLTVTLHNDGGTADGGVDTSAPQAFVLTVREVNDTPTAVPDTFTTPEDQILTLTTAQLLANDLKGPVNEASQTLTVVGIGPSPAHCTVSMTGDTLTFTPDADFNGSASFQITIQDDGNTTGVPDFHTSTTTVTITVTPVNDAPSFTKGVDQTVNEDCGPQTVSSWATAVSAGPVNESAQSLNFVVANDRTSLFIVQPAISPEGTLTYTPAPDANGPVTITVALHDSGGDTNGGIDTSISQTFTITVNAVNDTPSFTKGVDQPALEDCGPQTVTSWATAISRGPANEATQTLVFTVTGNTNPGLFTTAPAVSPAGTLTYTPAANANGTATITLTLTDDSTAGGAALTAAPQTFTIIVNAVNDAPSFTRGADQSVREDCGPQTVVSWATAISRGAANETAQAITFDILDNTNPSFFTVAPSVSPDGILTYTPAPDANGTAIIALVLHDDGGTANGGVNICAPQTFTVTLFPVNDAPSFKKGADQSVLEDLGPQTVPGWATTISAGPVNESAQSLIFAVTSNTNPLLFSVQPSVSSTSVLTYTPASDANGTATVTITLHDNGGIANGGVDTSAPQTFTIIVNAVNDAPSFTKGVDQIVNEDCGPQTVSSWATAVSAGPVNESAQSLTFTVVNDNPTLFSTQPFVSREGVLVFTPAPNRNGIAYLTVTLTDDDRAGGPAWTTPPQTILMTVTPVNDAPVCLVLPSISGIGVAGTTLTADAGGWDDHMDQAPGHIGISIQWLRATTASGAGAQPISGAIGTTYDVRDEDVGSFLGIQVTAIDDGEGLPAIMRTSAVSSFVEAIANDTTPPVVQFIHDLPVQVATSHLSIDVTVRDIQSGLRSLTVDGVQVIPYTDGIFRYDLTLKKGDNTFLMAAVDNAGNQWSQTYHVVYVPSSTPYASAHTMTLVIGSKTMTIDGTRTTLDAPAVIREDRTLVPLRATIESLGGTISWNAKTQQVTVKARGLTIILTIGKSMATVNGKAIAIDPKNSKVVPLLASGRTMLPVRFVAENLGLKVGWDTKTRTITLTWDD